MQYKYEPTGKLEKFGVKIYSALVENFPQTFFVGGMVRDLLLGVKVTDIDMATEARPDQVVEILKKLGIKFNEQSKNFGVIVAEQGNLKIEIATFRKDLKSNGRYPKVIFIKSPKLDSKRRDFTINALYLSLKSKKILDFNGGISDIKNRQIKFIGQPKRRIDEDPLRIIRAIRFALTLNFKFNKNTKSAIVNNLSALNLLSKKRADKEINKIFLSEKQKLLRSLLGDKKMLDKQFK